MITEPARWIHTETPTRSVTRLLGALPAETPRQISPPANKLTDRDHLSITCLVSRWQHIEGCGSVCFEADGSVRLVVSDEVADLVATAERSGIGADELVNKILDDAEARRLADGTGPVPRLEPPPWTPTYS